MEHRYTFVDYRTIIAVGKKQDHMKYIVSDLTLMYLNGINVLINPYISHS